MIKEWVRLQSFDSHLVTNAISESRNAALILELRVFLERCDASRFNRQTMTATNRPSRTSVAGDGMGDYDRITTWNDSEWRSWSAAVKSTVENTLNGLNSRGLFWMVPSGYWGVGWPPGPNWAYLPNVKCLINLRLVNEQARAHRWVRCFRYADDASGRLRQYMGGQSGMLTDRSNSDTPNISGNSQVTVVHEFLHALGMMHVNYPHERDTFFGGLRFLFSGVQPNDVTEYGTTGWSRASILGGGNRLEGWNFWPWLNRLQKHLDPAHRAPYVQWSFVDHWPRPQLRNRPAPTMNAAAHAGNGRV